MVLSRTPNSSVGLRKFEDLDVGQASILDHLLTKEDVDAFAKLTGDFNPVHLDRAFAGRTQFGKPIVHGMLTASFISTMIGMLIPGPGALWLSQSLDFSNPGYVGDRISVKAVVRQKSTSTRILVLDILIENQNGIQLVKGESVVRMLEILDQPKGEFMKEKEVILITGGSRGIGAATARKLGSLGYPIAVNFLQAEYDAKILVDEIVLSGGRAISIKGDVSIVSDVDAMFTFTEQTLGPIGSVIHCAAPIPTPQPFQLQTWELQQSHLDVQLRGAFNCAQRALPSMLLSTYGNFIFLGSIYGDGMPPIQQGAYVVAKAALAAFARTLAVEFGPKGIRVNTVAPGITQTEMISSIPEKTKMLAKMSTPLRRLAESSDIAEVIAFLISPAARHITGITLPVCGGLVM